MNFFRQLYGFGKQLKGEIKLNKERERQDEILEQKYLMIYEILKYVMQMDWLVQERTKERIRFYMQNRCSLQETAEQFEVKKDTISVAINYAEKCLAQKIDIQIINKLESCSSIEEILDIKNQFRNDIAYIQPAPIFYKEITKILPIPELNPKLSLKDCEKEIIYMKLFSKEIIEAYIKRLDTGKLAHILAVLYKKESCYEKKLLHKLFYPDDLDSSNKTEINIKKVVAALVKEIENK